MKQVAIRHALGLCLLAFSCPGLSEEGKKFDWRVLPNITEKEVLARLGKDAQVERSVDGHVSLIRDLEGLKPGIAGLDPKTRMLVWITGRVNSGIRWHVDEISLSTEACTICIAQLRVDGTKGILTRGLCLSIPRTTLSVRAAFRDVDGKGFCESQGVHPGLGALGNCHACGSETSSISATLCEPCAQERGVCSFCLKPLKK